MIQKLLTTIAIVISVLFVSPIYSDVSDIIKFRMAKKHFKRGMHYYNRMKYLAAVEFFRKAVTTYPEYYTARNQLARSYKLAGFTEAALKEWQTLYTLKPDNVYLKNKINMMRFVRGNVKVSFPFRDYIIHKTYTASEYLRYGFTHPIDLTVDKEKNIYITSFNTGNLIKYDINGKPEFTTKPSFSGKLYGIDYYNKTLAVTDFENDCIYIMDTTGSVIRTIGKSGKGNGMFNGPEGVAFNKQGFLYIVDSGNSRVQKLSLQGKFVLSFGKEGSYEGDFSKPTDVAVLHHKVYVVDRGNRRISVFDEYGNYMKSILSGELEIPRGVTVHGDSLLISDNVKGLLFYNTKSQKKQWLKKWKKNRSFNKLMSAVTDRDGFLYCLDYNYQALFTFSPKQLVYSNLDIEVTSVDIQKFPIVAFYMTVRSSQGSPLYGLKQSNFKVIEDGVVMRNPFVNYLRRLRPSVSMVFCMDRSEKSKAYTNDYPWAADFILKKMRVNDSVKVVNFHKNIWDGSSFDWSRRRTIRTMKKFRTTSKEKAIGKVLYNAISDVLPRLNRRAVLLFTDGSVSNESFQRYSADYIVEYAKAHYIPIYIISIKKPNATLQSIATQTGGMVVRPKEISKLRTIYHKIKKSEEYRYILVYNSYKMSTFKGWWADVKIEINHKGQKGVEHVGYFIP